MKKLIIVLCILLGSCCASTKAKPIWTEKIEKEQRALREAAIRSKLNLNGD